MNDWIRKNSSTPLSVEKHGEVVYLQSQILKDIPWLAHGFSTRMGGVSRGDVGSMNLGFARKDDPDNVRENFRRMAAALDVDPNRLTLTAQTHTTTILQVDEQMAGSGLAVPRDYTDVDGLITNVPGVTLAVFMADCVPLLAADPVHHAIGAVHSGWRGTVGDIGGKMIRMMQQAYGSRPEDILCVIGPSICRDCYEVSEDVIEKFEAAFGERAVRLYDRKDNGHYQLDLWEACRENFLRSGVKEEHIQVTDICTKCNPEYLFSHRVHGDRRGVMAGLVGIRERG